MAYLNDRVYDFGLNVLDTEVNRLDICSTEPTTYTQAITTYSLGNKTSFAVGSPAARSGGGREVTCPAVTDGTVTLTGTAGFLALVDTVNLRLLATQSLNASQVVTLNNVFTLTSFKVGIPSPA